MTRAVSPSPGSSSSAIPGAPSQQAAGSFPETYSDLSTSCVTSGRSRTSGPQFPHLCKWEYQQCLPPRVGENLMRKTCKSSNAQF